MILRKLDSTLITRVSMLMLSTNITESAKMELRKQIKNHRNGPSDLVMKISSPLSRLQGVILKKKK